MAAYGITKKFVISDKKQVLSVDSTCSCGVTHRKNGKAIDLIKKSASFQHF